MKQVGIVGLGLIGGSLAKAYRRAQGIRVLGVDRDKSIMEFAKIAEAIDDELTDDDIPQCDLILLAIFPQGIIDWVQSKAELLRGVTVIDCAGTKGRVCDTLFPVARENGFTFVGGHPMAGLHRGGFKYSREDLFDDQPMVIVPPAHDDIRLFDHIKTLLAPVCFGRVSVTTAEEHDKIIAFASQLPHVLSNAFVKSPTATRHKGYSAGSYRDLSRVAQLDPDMWTELFLENKSYLKTEIDLLLAQILRYRDAIAKSDATALRALLDEGSRIKREVDGP